MSLPEQFSRTQMLLGAEAMDALARSHVIVFGIGGVGGTTAEALARSGVGAIDLVDPDVVSATNINRQTVATLSTIGMPKVDVMAARIADINPACNVAAHQCFYLPETKDRFDLGSYDYIVDTVDTVTGKLLIIGQAHECGVPVISSMGAANKLDPTAFEVADIADTTICPLAKIIRKECRKRGIEHFKVVYSKEPALVPEACDEQPAPGRRSIPGSVAFVPPAAGLAVAGQVVRDLIEQTKVEQGS